MGHLIGHPHIDQCHQRDQLSGEFHSPRRQRVQGEQRLAQQEQRAAGGEAEEKKDGLEGANIRAELAGLR